MLLKFPIVQTAKKCGIPLDPRTLSRVVVEAQCPFCGDQRHHLFLYTSDDHFHCFRCRAHGNAVSLYARCNGLSYAEAYHELADDKILRLPQKREPQPQAAEPAPIEQRHTVYSALLNSLTLSQEHRENLLERGLTNEAIEAGGYRSLPYGKEVRDALAASLSQDCDLMHVPGFYTANGIWQFTAWSGLLIPVRDHLGRIQGIQVRLDRAEKRKYRWISSADLPNGAPARGWVHVTGDTSRRTACITEGALKGDISSLLTGGTLFLCVAGVDSTALLPETLKALKIHKVYETFDMDKLTNPHVRDALKRLQKLLAANGVQYRPYHWNPEYKGVDDYLWARSRAI